MFGARTCLVPLLLVRGSSSRTPADLQASDPTRSEPLLLDRGSLPAGITQSAGEIKPSDVLRKALGRLTLGCTICAKRLPLPFHTRLRVLAVPSDWPGTPITQPTAKGEGECVYVDDNDDANTRVLLLPNCSSSSRRPPPPLLTGERGRPVCDAKAPAMD